MAENDQHTNPQGETPQPGPGPEQTAEAAGGSEQTEAAPQDASCVEAAAEAVERARAEFERAWQYYQKVRQEAAEQLKEVRETTVGDLLDGLGRVVRKFPGPSLLVALVVGFLLGRKSRW